MAMLIRVNVRPNLRSAQPQFTDGPFQLARRQLWILQRDCRQAGEPRRMITDNFGHVIIEMARKIERIGWFRPIAEHHRHGGKHLHRHANAVTFLNAAFRIPHIVGDFAKDAIANHHPGAARLVVVEPNEPAVAVFGVEIEPIVRKDVRVQIDLHLNEGRDCKVELCRL